MQDLLVGGLAMLTVLKILKLISITSFYGLHQISDEVNHILNGKRVLTIPSLFINNEFVNSFQGRANVPISFEKKCSLISSSCDFPAKISSMAKDRNQTTCFSKSNSIKAIDVSKAHRLPDEISVKMIKFCADSMVHTLTLIF